jgi:hypothetical protein
LNVLKNQTPPSVEDLVALMEPDVLYAPHEFLERIGGSTVPIRTILDLAVTQRQMERVVHRKRHHYRLPPPLTGNGQPTLSRQDELAGWEKQWRQFRAMCEASRPNTPGRQD